MYLDYSRLKSGRVRQPVLRLKSLAGKTLGSIPFVHNLKFDIRYADVSEISFDVPYMCNGMVNPLYAALSSYKLIDTDDLGIYVLTAPQKSGDGMSEIKTVRGYSLEKLFEKKRLFLEEGTYNFWNPATPDDTILGRIVETDTTWRVGYVDPRLIGCYRTFDEYDSDPLSFCYGDASEKYQCAVVFDVYNKTINAYDANKSRGTLPIYLSYRNLVDAVSVDEIADGITTKLRVYGSDGLSIRDVNPTGADYLVNLDYFISNGDLDVRVSGASETLAQRVRSWEAQIAARRQYYTGLVAARSSKTAQRIMADVELGELNGELEKLKIQQSVIIQAYSLETTESGRASQQSRLNAVNAQIAAKQTDIANKEAQIAALQTDIDSYSADILSIHNDLAFTKFFTEEEQKILNLYLIENEVSEETFVASDVDTAVSGALSSVSGNISINGSSIERVSVDGKQFYSISGGSLNLDDARLNGDIVRGTLEIGAAQSYVLTAYLGETSYGARQFPSGMITMSGSCSQISGDIAAQSTDGVTTWSGTQISMTVGTSTTFFTVNVNDYQRYSVAQELYDFGADVLSEKAWPVYEFGISSANFLYQKEFAPFKDALELGKGVHLSLGSDGNLTANIIGVSIDFEQPSDFSLIFSNQFRSIDRVLSPIDAIKQYSAASRSFDASKYIYNRAANKTTQVARLMEGQINAAVNTINAAQNQSVRIDGSGVNIGGDSKYQIRIVNEMIALSDDNFKTAKVAIGHFASPETGEQNGVNAEMIAGKLYVGHNLILENAKDDGTMMFKVDATGAWLYNAPYVMQSDRGGKLLIDPDYGLVAGNGDLFTTSGTSVTPAFIDASGELIVDRNGMPRNANFYLDARDGSAYFRGKVVATSGTFSGTVYATDGEFAGSVKARNLYVKNGNSWLSVLTADKAALDGTYVKNLNAGNITAGKLDAQHINTSQLIVGNNITMGANARIAWSQVTNTSTLTDSISNAQNTANNAVNAASDAASLARKIANGELTGGTFINGREIYSPTIYADEFVVKPRSTDRSSDSFLGGYSMYGYYDRKLYHMFNIHYEGSAQPYVVFHSPAQAAATWDFGSTYVHGTVDVTSAKIVGLDLTARFG